ncbi:adaptin ear-binding coat-associated protein 1 NECAP-1 [Choiromyces venosus 120613-1]|uniref:Adaptin ear-binding coat-associated protein 1 NECAP-1 n=1 Tax=Choiromyces venosus 120613-1 TaxID=1336337 RepID=A0A3N4JM02_9PEZI|nr:adaptin ear-binding coat-associated protein 1 NECAP-1 [Choiromyces venosus 120613-1]
MDSIQRVLFIAPKVHIYAVPPLSSNSGYKAGDWKVDQEKSRIFTARVRIVETATEDADGKEERVSTDVRLEDPATGDLFANCPYEGAHCVEQVIDSSRFFALRVVDGPRKAMLGIGFEERSEAFDFGVSLQEVRRHSDSVMANEKAKKAGVMSELSNVGAKDYSLKEGETINITIGNKGRRRAPSSPSRNAPTGGFPLPFLPPPPSAEDVKRRQSQHGAEDFGKLGFDDDAFGDFV